MPAVRPEGPPAPPPEALLLAFVQGARWWEYRSRGATMWASDRAEAWKAAQARQADGTLGTDTSPGARVNAEKELALSVSKLANPVSNRQFHGRADCGGVGAV